MQDEPAVGIIATILGITGIALPVKKGKSKLIPYMLFIIFILLAMLLPALRPAQGS